MPKQYRKLRGKLLVSFPDKSCPTTTDVPTTTSEPTTTTAEPEPPTTAEPEPG